MAKDTSHSDNEHSHPPAWRAWAILAVMLLGYVLWTVVIYLLVGERDRDWLYGARPSIPSESYYSTQVPQGTTVPDQIAPLPAPVPLDEVIIEPREDEEVPAADMPEEADGTEEVAE